MPVSIKGSFGKPWHGTTHSTKHHPIPVRTPQSHFLSIASCYSFLHSGKKWGRKPMTYYSTYQTHPDSLGSEETVTVPTYGAGCGGFCMALLHALLWRACGTLSQIWPLSITCLQVKRFGLVCHCFDGWTWGQWFSASPGPSCWGDCRCPFWPLGTTSLQGRGPDDCAGDRGPWRNMEALCTWVKRSCCAFSPANPSLFGSVAANFEKTPSENCPTEPS